MAAEYLLECFWPGVEVADLRALDERASRTAAEASVRYLGSLLMRDDEVVLCLFAGEPAAVLEAARRAQIPFERIVSAARSPWHATATE
jgi:hypothetical protein